VGRDFELLRRGELIGNHLREALTFDRDLRAKLGFVLGLVELRLRRIDERHDLHAVVAAKVQLLARTFGEEVRARERGRRGEQDAGRDPDRLARV
jgi:hypothetical protein